MPALPATRRKLFRSSRDAFVYEELSPVGLAAGVSLKVGCAPPLQQFAKAWANRHQSGSAGGGRK